MIRNSSVIKLIIESSFQMNILKRTYSVDYSVIASNSRSKIIGRNRLQFSDSFTTDCSFVLVRNVTRSRNNSSLYPASYLGELRSWRIESVSLMTVLPSPRYIVAPLSICHMFAAKKLNKATTVSQIRTLRIGTGKAKVGVTYLT